MLGALSPPRTGVHVQQCSRCLPVGGFANLMRARCNVAPVVHVGLYGAVRALRSAGCTNVLALRCGHQLNPSRTRRVIPDVSLDGSPFAVSCLDESFFQTDPSASQAKGRQPPCASGVGLSSPFPARCAEIYGLLGAHFLQPQRPVALDIVRSTARMCIKLLQSDSVWHQCCA